MRSLIRGLSLGGVLFGCHVTDLQASGMSEVCVVDLLAVVVSELRVCLRKTCLQPEMPH